MFILLNAFLFFYFYLHTLRYFIFSSILGIHGDEKCRVAENAELLLKVTKRIAH